MVCWPASPDESASSKLSKRLVFKRSNGAGEMVDRVRAFLSEHDV